MRKRSSAPSYKIGYFVRISYSDINKDKIFRSSFLVSTYKISFDYLLDYYS